MIKKLLAIVVLGLLWSGNAYAEWTFAFSTGNVYTSDFYYDKKTKVKKVGGNTFFWLLQDITNPTSDTIKKGQKSKAHHTEVDCRLKRFRWIQIIIYSEQMGKGKVMNSFSYNDDDWSSVPPGSERYDFFDKKIC
jgi:hypothetical protein